MRKRSVLFLCAVLVAFSGAGIYLKIHRQLKTMAIDTSNVIAPTEAPTQPNDTIPSDAKPDSVPVSAEPDKPKRKDLYVLAVGVDTRGEDFTLNTDSLLVAHLMPQTHSVKLLSIPRDTRVENPEASGGSPAHLKINAVFAQGYEQAYLQSKNDSSLLSGKSIDLNGYRIPEEYISSGLHELKTAVGSLLDVDIDYTFFVNFRSVEDLVNEVGGITVDVPRAMYYDDSSDGTHIHLEPGTRQLNGREALDYARFRKDNRGEAYYSNDFERGDRQQQVIRAIADKLESWQSIGKALSLLDIVTHNVKTDMSMATMVSLTNAFYGKLDADGIESLSFDGDWVSPYVVISDEKLDTLRRQFQSVDAPALSQASDGKPAEPESRG